MDLLKDLISNRGVQLLARYGGNALMALGTKYAVEVSADDANAAAKIAAAFVGAGICWLIDHYSHAKQAAA